MYIVRMYLWINPYMMGLHLTNNSYRPFRGVDGFKLRGKELENALAWGLNMNMPCHQANNDPDNPEEEGPLASLMAPVEQESPVDVRPVPQFWQDLDYLTCLTEADAPPQQLYQAKHVAALFVIGNTSGKAKGAVVVTQYDLYYESGVWSQLWRGKSLNVREAENLMD
jgi:hypothetical protein